MAITEGIKNIIFDWGGVIINIDYRLTKNAFINLGLHDFESHYSQFRQKDLFDKLDTGKISSMEFFEGIKKEMPDTTTIEQIKDAWNSMLLDFPVENFNFLQDIKKQYRTFLFSNTNEPHLQYYFVKLKNWFDIESMDPLFEKAYYSCRFGLRKPDVESYRRILEENNLDASETLFIDDSPQNITGAQEAGLKTWFFKSTDRLDLIFS